MVIETELLFLFLKGMTGAVAPFSYLVFRYKEIVRGRERESLDV